MSEEDDGRFTEGKLGGFTGGGCGRGRGGWDEEGGDAAY